MIKIFPLLLGILCFSANTSYLFSQTQPAQKDTDKPFFDQLGDPGTTRHSILIYGGFNKYIYAYRDERFKGDDKGDYIKTDAVHGGFEFMTSPFTGLGPDLKDVTIGGNFSYFNFSTFTARTLDAVATIPQETVPEAAVDRSSKSWINIGFFVGYNKKWFGTDLGLTLRMRAFNEKKRERIDGTFVDGRGWIWDEYKVFANYFLRLGIENKPHYTLDVMRHDYDLRYGMVQSRIIFPIFSFFSFNVGAYHYKTDAIFLEPVIKVFGASLSFKVGSILNYHAKNSTRVGISDSIFYAGALSYSM
jgi:hypothetical protein